MIWKQICRGLEYEGKPPKKPKDAQQEAKSENEPEAMNVREKGADYIDL